MSKELQPYPTYKDSGVEWLGQIPAHWDCQPHRSLFEEVKEQGHVDEPLLSVTIARGIIPQSDLLSDSSKKDSSNLDKSKYKLVLPGDIAYNKMRAWQGAVGVSRYQGIVSPAYIVSRLRTTDLPEYFHYLFRTPVFATEAERWSYGITSDQWSLRPEHFKMIYSCVPPESEQEAIVRYLHHMDRKINRFIANRRRLIALLNEQKQAIINQAVTRGLDPNVPMRDSGIGWLGEIPAHWEVKRLKWVTRLQRGYDLPQDKRIQGAYPVVSSGGIIDSHHEAKACGPGVVMGRYGSTNAVFYIEQNFWPHNTSLFVTNFQGNDTRWSYFLLRAISKGDHSGKSAVPGIDRKDLFDIPVAVPPILEQMMLAQYIDKCLGEHDEMISRAQREIDLIREYRTRLIADVVTGKVDVRALAASLPEPAAEELADVLDAELDDAAFDEEGEEGTESEEMAYVDD